MALKPELDLVGYKLTSTNSQTQLIAANSGKKLMQLQFTQGSSATSACVVYRGTAADDAKIIASARFTGGQYTPLTWDAPQDEDADGLNIKAGVFIRWLTGTVHVTAYTRKY